MEIFLNSGVLHLFVVVFALVVIVYLFLKFNYGQGEERNGKRKVHLCYISGIFSFIVIELITYICVNNDKSTDIISYISFASTLSSLLLSVVAIIYAIVSGNKGEEQYKKIDMASDKVSLSVDKFADLSDNITSSVKELQTESEDLLKNMKDLQGKIDDLRDISAEARDISAEIRNLTVGMSGVKDKRVDLSGSSAADIFDTYISRGSFYGDLVLLACVYSKEKTMNFSLSKLSDNNNLYYYGLGYMLASSAVGIVEINLDDENNVEVISVYPKIKEKLLEAITKYIDMSDEEGKKYGMQKLANVKSIFGITE